VSSSDREVPDPYYGGPSGFEKVLDLLDDGCDRLLDHLEKESA
jgi:protein-tyrosine phosphatase